jgi:hypothetical protein
VVPGERHEDVGADEQACAADDRGSSNRLCGGSGRSRERLSYARTCYLITAPGKSVTHPAEPTDEVATRRPHARGGRRSRPPRFPQKRTDSGGRSVAFPADSVVLEIITARGRQAQRGSSSACWTPTGARESSRSRSGRQPPLTGIPFEIGPISKVFTRDRAHGVGAKGRVRLRIRSTSTSRRPFTCRSAMG